MGVVLRCAWVAAVAVALGGAQQVHGQTGDAAKDGQVQQSTPYAPYAPLSGDPCYHSQNHDRADLCAQWRAAIAAEESANTARRAITWSIVSAILSASALGALLWTLWQTEHALGEAKRGNEIAENTAKRQLRAYLCFRNARIRNFIVGQIPEYHTECWNLGQTPAFEYRQVVHAFDAPDVKSMGGRKVRMDRPPGGLSMTQIGPGTNVGTDIWHKLFEEPLTQAVYDAAMAGNLVFGLFGWCCYRDIYKRRHATTFKAMLLVKHLKDGETRLMACQRGNYAS